MNWPQLAEIALAEKDWSEFEYSLLLEMVWVILKAGDHDSLVDVVFKPFSVSLLLHGY